MYMARLGLGAEQTRWMANGRQVPRIMQGAVACARDPYQISSSKPPIAGSANGREQGTSREYDRGAPAEHSGRARRAAGRHGARETSRSDAPMDRKSSRIRLATLALDGFAAARAVPFETLQEAIEAAAALVVAPVPCKSCRHLYRRP